MKPHQIESWVLNIVDRVKRNEPIEDFRVELKSEWIDSEKAARRIAGHANAARGTSVLWLIGVDEKKGITGAKYEDLANWYTQVQTSFDGLAPRFTDLNIPVDGKTVVALLFETNRAPFVVKNPMFGKAGGGPVQLEVPWREGTSIRSATRADLLRLLSPLETLSEIEHNFKKEVLALESELKSKEQEAEMRNDATAFLKAKREYDRKLELAKQLRDLEIARLEENLE